MEEYCCNEDIYDADGVVHPSLIMSASGCNVMEEDSLEYHRMFCPSEYAPILGYFSTIDDSDIGHHMISGEEIGHEDIGKEVFCVIRGHHRSTVAREKGILIKYAIQEGY